MNRTVWLCFLLLLGPGGFAVAKLGTLSPAYFDKRLGPAEQIIMVSAESPTKAAVALYEKKNQRWEKTQEFSATLGRQGFATPGQKIEGDQKAPSGIFAIDSVFGYAPNAPTKMSYRQCTREDKFIDDPDSPQYNSWVHGPTTAKTFENMRLETPLYEYGFILRYNMDPVVKGKGSAIFFHVWLDPQTPTSGCVALSRENMMSLIGWIDPRKNPRVIMNPEAL